MKYDDIICSLWRKLVNIMRKIRKAISTRPSFAYFPLGDQPNNLENAKIQEKTSSSCSSRVHYLISLGYQIFNFRSKEAIS